jgi:hypothetical protein
MALDFPNNPSLNQIFTSPSGKRWKWNGVKWTGFGGAEPVLSLSAINTPTVNLNYNTDTKILSGLVNDSSLTNTKLAFDGGSFCFRNKIINGGFDIWQRGTTFTGVGAGVFTADRWTTSSSTATLNKNILRQPMSVSDLPFTEAGLTYCLRASYTSGTNTSELPICQPIELTRTGSPGPFKSGQIYTLSYYARCQSNNTIRWSLQFRDNSNTGTNASQGPSELQTITTSWTRYSHTFTLHSPNATNTSLCVTFTNNATPANTNIDITGVQLEEGSVVTPFEQRPIGTELALCQRYYEKSYNIDVTPGTANSAAYIQEYSISGSLRFIVDFKTSKRAVPTIVIYNPRLNNTTGSAWRLEDNANIGVTPGPTSTEGFHTGGVGSLSFGNYYIHYTASAEI